MDRENQINFERNEIADIIASSFDSNGETWDASDFEWSAHCVQMAGYRKQSDVAREIFWEIDKLLTMFLTDDDDGTQFIGVDMQKYYSLKKKYTEESGNDR